MTQTGVKKFKLLVDGARQEIPAVLSRIEGARSKVNCLTFVLLVADYVNTK